MTTLLTSIKSPVEFVVRLRESNQLLGIPNAGEILCTIVAR